MTARSDAQAKHERFFAAALELDLDSCKNYYGKGPCTAALGAGNECYNTIATCQDKPHYNVGAVRGDGSTVTGTVTFNSLFNYERTDSFSAFVRFRVPAALPLTQIFVGKAGATSRGFQLLIASAGVLRVQLVNNDASNVVRVETTTRIDDGQWHTAGFSYTGTSAASGVTVYIDGAVAATNTLSNSLSATIQASTDLVLANALLADIAEVRLYKRALSAQDHLDLHQYLFVATTSITLLLAFLENSGTTVADFSGNALNATLGGAFTWIKGPPKTYKFCSRKIGKLPPGELVRPYIEEWDSAPTEIDPNGGLARSSKTTLTLADEPSTDYECDKYVATRATPANGTYLARLLARNINYTGRFARLRLGYPVDPWDWNTFQTELYTIDSMELDHDGALVVVLKDPIKLADNTKIPTPTDGALTADISTTGATSFSVTAGKGAQYGTGTIYVRIGDEILAATRATDTFTTSGRGGFGTTPATHKTNDKVQVCKVYVAAALTDIIIDMLNASGISSTYIDTVQMAAENSRWLSQYTITTGLSEPTAPSTYIGELCRESNSMMWWHPVQQKFKFKVNMPESGTAAIPLFNETGNLREKSIALDVLDEERLTYGAFFCNLVPAVANRSEDKNYLFGSIFIDTDAESANEYNDRRAEIIRSRFLTALNSLAAVATASRMVAWRRDPPFKLKFALDPKDYSISVGDLIDVNTRRILDAAGNNKVVRVRVVKLVDKGTHIEIETRSTKFRNRYGFIAPNGTPDYPTDQVYAHICRTTPSQTMTNGDGPYLTI
jgi:hypothetical protein